MQFFALHIDYGKKFCGTKRNESLSQFKEQAYERTTTKKALKVGEKFITGEKLKKFTAGEKLKSSHNALIKAYLRV